MAKKQKIEDTMRYRKEIAQKGWATKGDICRFVPCCYQKANQLYELIRSDVKANGFENLFECVSVERLCKYTGIKLKDILN
ncbi:MAG: hypothetical protein Q4B56_05540 [Erysipelotrichaceae bacterium]|nr:hypothetical protein [Erysipelotrichaceae bacterium]